MSPRVGDWVAWAAIVVGLLFGRAVVLRALLRRGANVRLIGAFSGVIWALIFVGAVVVGVLPREPIVLIMVGSLLVVAPLVDAWMFGRFIGPRFPPSSGR